MEKHDADDPLAVYLREVRAIESLTKDEEAQLFQELRNEANSDTTRENIERRLLESRLTLVVAIAEKYSAPGVPMLDLIQEGNIGLVNAVKSFAEKPTGDFNCYAASCIEEAIAKVVGKAK